MTRSPDPGVGMRILYPVQCWLIRPVRFNAPSAPALRELAAAAAGSPFVSGAGPLRSAGSTVERLNGLCVERVTAVSVVPLCPL